MCVGLRENWGLYVTSVLKCGTRRITSLAGSADLSCLDLVYKIVHAVFSVKHDFQWIPWIWGQFFFFMVKYLYLKNKNNSKTLDTFVHIN